MISLMDSNGHNYFKGKEIYTVADISNYIELLDTLDREHGDIAAIDDSNGDALSFHIDGRVVFENLDTGGERHMFLVDRSEMKILLQKYLSDKDAVLIDKRWVLGY